MNGGNVVFHFKGDDKDLDKKTEGIASKFKSVGSAIGGAFVKGTAVAGAAVAGLTTAFLGAGEASQEFTEDMGKLTTGFSNANKGLGSMEQAVQAGKNSYRDFVGILGETDQSVEAVNHLAKLTNSQAELSKWSTIAAGVYATFGDSLPIEGLTEAANETAKVGQVTGPLADALNWAGVSEDKFNQQLAVCNSEQERSALITNTLNGLYEKAGQKYQEVNKNLIEARQAQSDFNSAMAEVGQLAMPFTSAIKSAGAGLLTSLVPGLKDVAEGVWGVVNGTAGASDKINSGFSNIINTLLNKFTSALPQLLSVGIQLITSLIQGVLQALPQIISAITSALPQLITAAKTLIPQLIQALSQALPQLISAVLQVAGMLTQALAEMAPTIIPEVIQAILQIIPILMQNLPLFIQAGFQLLRGIVQGLINSLPVLIAYLPTIAKSIIDYWRQVPSMAKSVLLDALTNLIPALITAITNIWTTVNNFFTTQFPIFIQKFKDFLKNFPYEIGQKIGEIVGNIATYWTLIIQKIQAYFSIIITKLKGFLGLMKQNAVSGIRNVANSIVNGFKNLPNTIKNIGANLVKGLWNGIVNMKNWIVNKCKNFAKSVIDGFKSTFKVHSPSRVFSWIGEMNMTGLYNGMEDMQPKVQQAIDGMFDLNPSLYGSTSTNLSPQVNVVNNVSMKQDPLGQMVQEIKTFSGGSKNYYNYGMGV